MAKSDIASGLGMGLSAYSSRKRSALTKSVGRARKRESVAAAKRTVVLGQREALEQRRQAEFLASRALAIAAAGGGGVDDSTVSKIISDIKGEGAYRAALEMYDAEEEARKIKFEGSMAEKIAEAEAKAENVRGFTGLLSQGTSMYASYKRGG
jgi:hypothetical protein